VEADRTAAAADPTAAILTAANSAFRAKARLISQRAFLFL
jgi:hypothetical protein